MARDPKRKAEILKEVEELVLYYDLQTLQKDKETLWELFLEGRIESRLVQRHGETQVEIMKRFDLSKLWR